MNEKFIWVEIETNKGINQIYTFRGKILKKDLKKWTNGKLIKKSIKLENTYWWDYINEEKTQLIYIIPGKEKLCDHTHYIYTGDYYILTKNITSIATFKNNSEYFEQIKKTAN